MKKANKRAKANGLGTTGHHGLKQVDAGISERVRTVDTDRKKNPPNHKANGQSAKAQNPPSPPSSDGPFKFIEEGDKFKGTMSRAAIERTFGTTDEHLCLKLLDQMMRALPYTGQFDPHWNYALATLHCISPRDAFEGLLSVHMVVVHNMSMEFFRRSGLDGQNQAGVDANVNLGAKLQKSFIALNAALEHHRARGLQREDTRDTNIYHKGEAQRSTVPINHHGSGDAPAQDGKSN